MRNIEVTAAYVMGVALPVLETARRRTHLEDLAFYVDDYLLGAVLLWAAWSVSRGRRHGPRLLAGAWGIACGGMWGSFFGQLRVESDVSGLPNGVVVAVKGAALVIALFGLGVSVGRGAGGRPAGPRGVEASARGNDPR